MEAVQHLKAQQVAGCPYVFSTQTGKHLSYRNLLATTKTACEAAGVGAPGAARTPALLRQQPVRPGRGDQGYL